MRVKIAFLKSDGNISLPLHYNYYVQAFIYRYMESVEPFLSSVLHREGFRVERGSGEKRFKLFTFSRIIGAKPPRKEGDRLIFPTKMVFLVVCSPVIDILEAFVRGLLRPAKIRIADEELVVKEVAVETLKEPLSGPLTVRTLSPITVRETVVDGEGKRRSIFLSPFSKEFAERIRANLVDKWRAFQNIKSMSDCEDDVNVENLSFDIAPEDGGRYKKKVLRYKDNFVEAWDGIFRIDGSRELLRMALYAGIGERNSQGFGCLEIVKR